MFRTSQHLFIHYSIFSSLFLYIIYKKKWTAQKCTCPHLINGKGSRYDLGSALEIDSCETGREKGQDTSSSSGATWVTQLCPTLCEPMDCSPLDSSVHGILQARILEWVSIPFSRGIFLTQGSDPGIEPRSHASQADSLLSELPGPCEQTETLAQVRTVSVGVTRSTNGLRGQWRQQQYQPCELQLQDHTTENPKAQEAAPLA